MAHRPEGRSVGGTGPQFVASDEGAGYVPTRIYTETTVTEYAGNVRPLETCDERTVTACDDNGPLNCCTDAPAGITVPVASVTELEPRLTRMTLPPPAAAVTLTPLTAGTDPSITGPCAMESTVMPVAPFIA